MFEADRDDGPGLKPGARFLDDFGKRRSCLQRAVSSRAFSRVCSNQIASGLMVGCRLQRATYYPPAEIGRKGSDSAKDSRRGRSAVDCRISLPRVRARFTSKRWPRLASHATAVSEVFWRLREVERRGEATKSSSPDGREPAGKHHPLATP